MSYSLGQADVPHTEVEITPQMLDAGFRVLCNSGIADEYSRADRSLVGQIFEAMYRVQQDQNRSSQSDS